MKIIWNTSNLLSFSRAFLSIPLYLSFYYHDKTLLVAMLFTASITDILDGYIARKRNQITDFGKLLDPVADKIFVTVFVLCLLFYNVIPLWFVIIIISRDILILIGGMFMIRKSKNIPYSDKYGKATVTVLGFSLLFIILEVFPSQYNIYLLLLNVLMVIISLSIYTNKFLLTIKKK